MVKKEFPNYDIVLLESSPETNNYIIDLFKKNKIRVSSATIKYNPDYPYMRWYRNRLIGTRKNKDTLCVRTKEEFLSYFFVIDNIIEVW